MSVPTLSRRFSLGMSTRNTSLQDTRNTSAPMAYHFYARNLKCCWFFSPSSFTHPLEDTMREYPNDLHSVPVSRISIAEYIFSSTLSFLQITFTSTEGPVVLQRLPRQQSLLLPGLYSPALVLCAVFKSRISLLYEHLMLSISSPTCTARLIRTLPFSIHSTISDL